MGTRNKRGATVTFYLNAELLDIWDNLTDKSKFIQEALAGIKRPSVKKKKTTTKAVATTKVSPVAKKYYEAIKALELPVRNHTQLNKKIRDMEKEVGAEKALLYLDFLVRFWEFAEVEYKPSLNDGIDIYNKRVSIKNAIERQQKANEKNKIVRI